MNFAELGLKPEVLRAVEDLGYTTPTPIQEQAIPVVLSGQDVLGIAQTGTGKTAGFTLPMIDMLANGRARARMPRSLILEPTRELAAQVAENFELYGKHEKLNYALLIGGSSFEEQIRKLDRGVDVLIATPGRMLDLFERGKVLLADVKILVIDEADRMLDMGFIPDIERIVGMLPPDRQTLMFSATMPPEIRRLADTFLTHPKEIAVAPPATTASLVVPALVMVQPEDKREALRRLLRQEAVRSALVFCNRKRDVTIVFRSLTKHGFNVGQLHGDMVQSLRTETLEAFKRGDIQILVCSDVAARGIDINDLSHVFNFDVPIHAEDYVHRIGRTGRAGRVGATFMLASPEDGRNVAAIERLIKQTIPVITLPGLESPSFETEDGRRGRRRRGGERAGGERAGGERAGGERDRAGSGRPGQPAEAGPRPGESTVRPDVPSRPAGRQRSGRPVPEGHPAEPRSGARAGDVRAGDGRRVDGRHTDLRSTDPRSNRRRREEPDEAVVGLGDHVPAFLLRPIRRRAPAAEQES